MSIPKAFSFNGTLTGADISSGGAEWDDDTIRSLMSIPTAFSSPGPSTGADISWDDDTSQVTTNTLDAIQLVNVQLSIFEHSIGCPTFIKHYQNNTPFEATVSYDDSNAVVCVIWADEEGFCVLERWEPLPFLVLLFECFNPDFRASEGGIRWTADMKRQHNAKGGSGVAAPFVSRHCLATGCNRAFTPHNAQHLEPDKRTGAVHALCQFYQGRHTTRCLRVRTDKAIESWRKNGIAQQHNPL